MTKIVQNLDTPALSLTIALPNTYQMQKYNETTKEFYPSQALRKGLKTNKEHDL